MQRGVINKIKLSAASEVNKNKGRRSKDLLPSRSPGILGTTLVLFGSLFVVVIVVAVAVQVPSEEGRRMSCR